MRKSTDISTDVHIHEISDEYLPIMTAIDLFRKMIYFSFFIYIYII